MFTVSRWGALALLGIIALFGGWRLWIARQVSIPKPPKASTTCTAADGIQGSVCTIGGRTVSLAEVREAMRGATIAIPEFSDTHVTLHDFTTAFESGPVRGSVTVFPEHLVVLPHDAGSADVFTHLIVETGGSGIFSYLAYFSYEPKQKILLFVDAVALGDRIRITTLRAAGTGAVRAELLERELGEPMSATPTVPATLLFAAHGSRLYGYVLRENEIVLHAPMLAAEIASPLTVRGKAKGSWFFEGSFPVALLDWDGRTIAEGIATSTENTMTESFVPFSATLTFPLLTDGDSGTLILKKDNPSGLPEHDAQIAVPVFFSHDYGSKG